MGYWLEWARGPAFIFSFSFMILGLVRHLALTFWEISRAWRRAGDKTLPFRQIGQSTLQWLFPAGRILQNPLFSLTSMVFHIAILVVPVFLAGHVALWLRSTGLSWPPIPNALADVLTIVAVMAALALVVQRLSAKSTRALSRFRDYALPLIIALPFVSGFMVMHPAYNPFSYSAVLFVHVMSANLVMVLIPLTKLTHAVLLPGVQLVSELGWHWPADAGSRLAVTLGKEGEPI
jgi:nitrate reductase gamma subunit